MVNKSVSQFVCLSVNQPASQPTSQSVSQPVRQAVSQAARLAFVNVIIGGFWPSGEGLFYVGGACEKCYYISEVLSPAGKPPPNR